jgi:large subunit ribosomal protein L23
MKNAVKKIIVRPVITEKTLKLVREDNKYTFMVTAGSGKVEIADAIARKFDVKVLNVRTVNVLGKKKTFGKSRTPGRRKSYKKAIARLEKGDNISVFEIK